MKSRMRIAGLAMAVSLLLIMLGCTGKHKLVADAPDWVNQGSGAFEDEGNRIFYGVGAVTGITTQPLAVQTADNRARADIGKQLETFVSNLYRDYQASTGANISKGTIEEQHVEDSLKTLTQVSVHGGKVLDHWKDPETNTIYSLVRVDLEGIKASLEEIKEMSPRLREFVRDNAEKAFDELGQQEKGR